MINIVFATLDCCMTTFTTKIAEDICTRFNVNDVSMKLNLIVDMQDEHLQVGHMWDSDFKVVLAPCIGCCIMMINTTSICLNILKIPRMTELIMFI